MVADDAGGVEHPVEVGDLAHSILGGSAWEAAVWRAVQRAGWDALHHAGEPTVFGAPTEPARPLAYVEGILADPEQSLLVAELGVGGHLTA